jgi:hypothetical protein
VSPLNPDVLDTVVGATIGSGCQFMRVEWDGDRVGPIAACILRAQLAITRPLAVYEVTGGPPRSYSLPELDPALIICSIAESRMTSAIARMLDTGALARLDLESASQALCMHILADFAIDRGFPRVSRRLRDFAKEVGADAYLVAPTDQDAFTEMRIASSSFSVLHEAGHVFWLADSSHRVLTGDELEAQILAASADWPEVRRCRDLDLDHLHQEISADVACVTWLWSTTKVTMPLWTGKEANPLRFVLAVAATFCAFALINMCGQVADDCASPGGLGAGEEQFARRVGFQVRLVIVIDLATKLAVQDLGDEAAAQPGISLALSQLVHRYEEMLTGFEHARYEAYNPEPAPTRRDHTSGSDTTPSQPGCRPPTGLLQSAWSTARKRLHQLRQPPP